MPVSRGNTKCIKNDNNSRYILAQALLEVNAKENVTQAPSNCNKSGRIWLTGKLLFEYIRKQILGSGKLILKCLEQNTIHMKNGELSI